jgi:hypothetical protein
MRGLLLVVLLASCAGASGGRISATVSDELVAMLPPEGRSWTYEAENEVIIALDRRDQAREEVRAAVAKIEKAEAAEDAASKRGKGKEVAKARIEWREKQKDHAESELEAAEIAIGCARANLELTKARLAVRFDLPIDDVDFVKKYEKQYDACAADLDKARLEAEQAKVAAGKAREQWRKTRAGDVAKTGDYDHGLWID